MRILLVNNLHRRRGGADIVYLNSGQLLEKAGHEVIYYSISSEGQEPCEQAPFFAPSPLTYSKPKAALHYFYNKDAARNLDALLTSYNPDIACVHLVWGGLSPSIFDVLHRHHIPAVHVVHDYRMICPAYTCKRLDNSICEECKGGHYFRCLKNKCSKGSVVQSLLMAMEMYYRQRWHHPVNNIDGFVFVSQFCKKKHIEFDTRFSRVPSIVLYNCAQQTDCQTEKSGYYLYYGRLSYEKGVSTLLQAASMLPDVKFKIAGTGPLEQWLKDTVQQKGIDNVELLGYKTGQALADVIGKSKFVVVPSEWYENNPMTIVESYSMGIPVIGANIGGIPEIIQEGKTGFVFETGRTTSLVDAIRCSEQLQDDEYLAMCRHAHAFAAESFNEEKYMERMIAFLSDIVNRYKMKTE